MKIPEFSHQIILSENRIKERVIELGRQISQDYMNRSPAVIGILKGSMLFFSDLIRNIELPVLTDFLSLSSYNGNMESTGNVSIRSDIMLKIKERDVLVVEDIVDTGVTLKFLVDHLRGKKPLSIKVCSLLNKKVNKKTFPEFKIDYTGFDVPDKFLIGYGMDYKEKYRNLPYIAIAEKGA